MQPGNLINHPEGGRFREVFRSKSIVTTNGGRQRSALTHIYFSLEHGEVSRYHRVQSDEVWNLYQGEGLRLYTWDGKQTTPHCEILSAHTGSFCHVVAAGLWQAAEPLGETVLVGCSVGPGFEFQDFQLMDPRSQEAGLLRSIDHRMSRLIDQENASHQD